MSRREIRSAAMKHKLNRRQRKEERRIKYRQWCQKIEEEAEQKPLRYTFTRWYIIGLGVMVAASFGMMIFVLYRPV